MTITVNLEEWKPAFIVTANTSEEVQIALNFANQHNLGNNIDDVILYIIFFGFSFAL